MKRPISASPPQVKQRPTATARWLWSPLLGLCLWLSQGAAQAQDQAIIETLDNGLQIMVWPHASKTEPDALNLQLLIKAGSLSEREDERGFAHLVEHLAFRKINGAADGQLQSELRDLGLSLGKHSNAFTSYDQTRYHLSLRESDSQKLSASLDILDGWARGIDFEDALIDKEVAVIQEERRRDDDALDDFSTQLQQLRYRGSRRAERQPIGQKQALAKADLKSVQRFYKRWYTPANTVIIASGKVEAEAFIEAVKQRMGDWRAQGPAPQNSEIEPEDIPLYAHLQDPKQSVPVLIAETYIARPKPSLERLRSEQRSGIFLDVLRKKLQEGVTASAGNIQQLALSVSSPSPGYYALSIFGAPAAGDFDDVTSAIVTALRKSFSQLNQASIDAQTEANLGQLAIVQSEAADLSAQLAAHALYQRPLLDDAAFVAMSEAAYQDLDPAALAALVRSQMTAPPWHVYTSSNRAEPAADVAKALADDLKRIVADTAVDTEAAPRPELDLSMSSDDSPAPAALREPSAPIARYELKNGMQLNIAAVDQAERGQISWMLAARGGALAVAEADYFAASALFDLAFQTGLRGLDGDALSDYLEAEQLRVAPMMQNNLHSISVLGSLDSLETQLRLLRIILEEAKISESVLAQYKTRKHAEITQLEQSPYYPFMQTVAKDGYNDHPLSRVMRPEEIDDLALGHINALLKRYLQTLAKGQLTLSGDIDSVERVAQTVHRILSPIALGQSEPLRAEPYPFVQPRDKLIDAGGNPEPRVDITRECILERPLPSTSVLAEVITTTLQERINGYLREDLALIYAVSLAVTPPYPPQRYTDLTLTMSTAPENEERTLAALDHAMQDYLQHGPNAAEIETAFDSVLSDRMQITRNHEALTYWLGHAALIDEALNYLIDPSLLKAPDVKQIASLSGDLLKAEHCIDIVWRP